jgi:hypothetical protein
MTTIEPATYEEVTTKKTYKDQAIRVATFLGGPLVAGYLIAENYKAFNELEKVKMTWVYTVVATVVIFGGVFFIPDSVNIPKIIIPLVYSWVTFYIVQSFQGAQMKTHMEQGGETFSWGRTLLIGLIGAVVTLAPIVIIVYFSLA